jgi:hypothetical protein
MPQSRGALAAVATAATLLLAGAGCGGDEPAAGGPSPSASANQSAGPAEPSSGEPSGDPSPAGSTREGPEPSPASPSTPADPSAPSSSAPTAGQGAGLSARQLPAADLPGFNATFHWQEQGTSPREPEDLATCNRFAVTSLGATRTLTRTYVPAGEPGPPARHLVAEFPDQATAARAYDVLGAWRRQCQPRLAGHDLRRVGPLTPVPVPTGGAGWYLLTYGPVRQGSEDAVFESTGMAIAGTRVAVLDMRLVGQDFNYAVGREPMVAAVQRAAALLP